MIDIVRLRKDIEGPSEDARFLAFMHLYESIISEATAEIARIMTLRDPVLKLMFLRFLGHMKDERAVELICRMMEDENPVVVDAAERAFDRNSYDSKLKIITPYIASSRRRAQLIAIDRVAAVGWLEALPLLLAQLTLADDELVLAVLSALRFLPGRSALTPITHYLNSKNDEIRFRALMALGTLYETCNENLRHVLTRFTEDVVPRVRQAAIWALCRKPLRRNLSILMRLSAGDPAPMVRQEALLGLKHFPSVAVIRHLLNMLTIEKDRMVMLRCESILLSMDHDELLRALESVVRHSSGTLRHRAILLAAEFQRGSDRYFRFLIKGLRSAPDDRDRVAFIEALGALGDPRAAAELVPYLEKSSLVSYVAMASLLKVSDESMPVLAYLESPSGSTLLKQMILRYLIRKNHLVAIHQERLEKCLLEFLQGDNINMRYLAAQVLVYISSTVAQEGLLKAVQTETDPTSIRLLRNSLMDFFTKDPSGFVTFLHDKRKEEMTFATLCSILHQLIWNGVDIIAQLPRLLSYDLVEAGGDYVKSCSLWLADQIIAGRVKLDDVLRTLEHTIVLDEVLRYITAQMGNIPNLQMSVSPMVLLRRLEEGSDDEKEAVIDLMGIARSYTSIPVLVSVVCNQKMEKFHERATTALARITQEIV